MSLKSIMICLAFIFCIFALWSVMADEAYEYDPAITTWQQEPPAEVWSLSGANPTIQVLDLISEEVTGPSTEYHYLDLGTGQIKIIISPTNITEDD